MNQPVFLHIVERLEGFLAKLPASIQKPVLHELTPLKELFLKQRVPRFVLTGSHRLPVQEVVATLFAPAHAADMRDVLMEVFRWQNVTVGSHGTVSILDARGADEGAMRKIEEELRRESADMFLHLADGNSARPVLSRDVDNLATVAALNRAQAPDAKIIGLSLIAAKSAVEHNGKSATADRPTAQSKLQAALADKAGIREHL